MDIKGKVTGAMGGLERLGKVIPGYEGHKEKELRREADKLLREHLARKLDEQRRRLPGLQRQLIEAKRLDLVSDLESAVMKLQTLIDRLRTASYGYSGFFDAIKVEEEQLDTLYDFDKALLDEVPKVAEGIDKVAEAIAAEQGIAKAITDLTATLQAVTETFNKRQEVILQAS